MVSPASLAIFSVTSVSKDDKGTIARALKTKIIVELRPMK